MNMFSERQLMRQQTVLLLGCVGLLVYSWFVYCPLSRRVAEQDKPVTAAWKELAAATKDHKLVSAVDAATLEAGLQQIKDSLTDLHQAAEFAQWRMEAGAELRAKVNAPFQLLDFENSRLQVTAELRQLADTNQVTLDPAAVAGLPEFVVGRERPGLIWAQLALANQVLATAIVQQPKLIKHITMLPPKSHPATEGKPGALEEIPMRIELVGPTAALLQFVRSLPVRSVELKELGLREVPVPRPALFVDRFILKAVPDAPNFGSADVIVVGFISRDES